LHSMSYQKKNKIFCTWVLIKICFTDQQWKFSYTCRLCLWLCGLFQFSYSKKILLDSLCGLFINSVADVIKRFADADQCRTEM
jgi:hypothetical protein